MANQVPANNHVSGRTVLLTLLLVALVIGGYTCYGWYFPSNRYLSDRDSRIAQGFCSWDGSHWKFTERIKASLDDPTSYQHVRTSYVDKGDHLVVTTVFSWRARSGDVYPGSRRARCDLDGGVIEEIYE